VNPFRCLLTAAREQSVSLSPLRRQCHPRQGAGQLAGPAWCRMADAVTLRSCSPSHFGRHSCPQARMCSSCESPPQRQMLMCHYTFVRSLRSLPGAGAEQSSTRARPARMQSCGVVRRNRNGKFKGRCDMKGKVMVVTPRQQQQQLLHMAGTAPRNPPVSIRHVLTSAQAVAALHLQLEMREGLLQSIQHRQNC